MRKGNPQKKYKKFRILLDSAFAHVSSFPKLSKKAKLAHIVHTHNFPLSCEDKDIYQKAMKEDMFVLTINFKHFKKLVKKGRPGIIGIESQLSNVEIDELVSDFITGKNPADYLGQAIKI